MTEAQFVKNHRGIDQGQDPPKELLEGMYRRIKVGVGWHPWIVLSCALILPPVSFVDLIILAEPRVEVRGACKPTFILTFFLLSLPPAIVALATKASEIRMDEGDMYESEVITFVAPKKSGWLKKKGTGELFFSQVRYYGFGFGRCFACSK